MAHPQAAPAPRQLPLSRAVLVLIAVAVWVVGVLGGAGIGWLQRPDRVAVQPAPTPGSSTSVVEEPSSPPTDLASPSPEPSPTTMTPSPSPTRLSKTEAERQARTELETLAGQGYVTANPSGQWVAQLSSKYIGITDPNQTARVSGGHKFAAADIVAEYKATKQQAEPLGATVVLIKGSDIKKGRDQSSNRLFWYVFGLEFDNKAQAGSFCRKLYPRLSSDRLENVCFATQLNP